MNQLLIPMFLQVLLTFGILFASGFLRYRSVGKRTVNPKDYVLMTGQDQWPVLIQKLGRSFHNQLEVPLLFYVWTLMTLLTGIESQILLYMAWAYVGLRYVHAFIHIGYNNVLHRFSVFLISCLLLLSMWFILFSNAMETGWLRF
ncbi:MAG: MAPEG family protein [Marinicella sp.]|nr:MAPEG family protein [Xanthomonadales bacterium]